MPKIDPKTKQRLVAALPERGVEIKPMFANIGALANGHMFAGVFGDRILIKLPEERRSAAEREGAIQFEMMPGRPMKDYVETPQAWIDDPAKLRQWLKVGFDWASALPAKKKEARKKAVATKSKRPK